jgi:type IV pilus assembly protein PilF
MKRPLARPGLRTAILLRAAALAFVTLLGACASQPAAEFGRDAAAEAEETDARKRARARLALAVGYFEQGQTNVALDELRTVLAVDPSFADAYNLRGLIFMRLNDQRQAEESFRRAVQLNPRDSQTLHNLGWLQCQQRRFDESLQTFDQVLANPLYTEQAKTLMAKGVCQARAGRPADAERSLSRAYELDAGNPIVGYNGELQRAQFMIRRINNSELANAETLWLGVKVERRLGDRVAASQLADQLRRRFPQSREIAAFDRGAFDE